MKKNKGLTIAAIVMAAVLVLGAVSYFTGGIASDWLDRQRNPDNVITMDDYVVAEDGYKNEGIKLEVDDLGVLTLDGKLESGTALTVSVAELTLKPGTYTLTGCEDPSDETYNLEARYIDENGATQVWKADNTTSRTRTFTTDVVVVIEVRVQSGYEADDVDIFPVISEGKTSVDFYDDNGVWGWF